MRASVGTLVGVIPLVLLAACTGPTQPAASPSVPSAATPSVSPSSAAPAPDSSTPEATEPRGEVPLALPSVEKPEPQGGPWDQLGVTISDAEQADAAASVPESFIAYVKARLAADDETGCAPASFELTASHRDGFVYGAENSPCDAGFALWGIEDGEWRYLLNFQDPPQCADLTDLGVPVDVPGLACEDEDYQVRNY